jgi:hypothetical protein
MMNLRITIIAVMIISIVPFYSYCWVRDANISDSKNAIGFGSGGSGSFVSEKIIDAKTSIGLSLTHSVTYTDKLKDIFDVTYNKQIAGESGESYACSIYGGFMVMDHNISVPSWEQNWEGQFVPEFGTMFRWNINDVLIARVNLLYFILPWDIQLAYIPSQNIELSLGAGMRNVSLIYLY